MIDAACYLGSGCFINLVLLQLLIVFLLSDYHFTGYCLVTRVFRWIRLVMIGVLVVHGTLFLAGD